MVSIVRIETLGNELLARLDDGTAIIAEPTGRGIWKLPPINAGNNAPPPSGGGGTVIPPTNGLPPAPNTLTVGGRTFNSVNLNHARDIIAACQKVPAANTKQVMRIVLITAIVETGGLYMYSNITHYPETANYPHDRDGRDSDSVGLFQQRPVAGWGTPRQCMDTEYSVNAFLGGPGGSPNRGLFDIPNWQTLSPGTAAQKVQVSAFPSRYDVQVPAADGLIAYFLK